MKTATQLARQLHQSEERTQVVYNNKGGRNRLPVAESNGTPAMDPGHWNIDMT